MAQNAVVRGTRGRASREMQEGWLTVALRWMVAHHVIHEGFLNKQIAMIREVLADGHDLVIKEALRLYPPIHIGNRMVELRRDLSRFLPVLQILHHGPEGRCHGYLISCSIGINTGSTGLDAVLQPHRCFRMEG